LKKSTEEQIISLTLNMMAKIDNLSKHSIEELKKLYPFHAIFFPDDALPYAKKERSIVTILGTSYYPQLAEIIAKEKYSDVHREFEISKEIDVAKISTIDNILSDLRRNQTKPDHFKEIDMIASSKGQTTEIRRIIADLYIGDHEDGEMFIELKSPMPNLDVCIESKKKMLTFLALKMAEKRKAAAWFGLTYNPYGEGRPYKWSFTKKIMDMERQVVIGKSLWDVIGGKGTFEEILRIMFKVKERHSAEKSRRLV
jgi:hypothetical protein